MIKSKKFKPTETACYYCGSAIDRLNTKKRLFCSDECRKKYWKGVHKKLWPEGASNINPDDKPSNSNKRIKIERRLK
jgi:uncharacterized protein with PIN domain